MYNQTPTANRSYRTTSAARALFTGLALVCGCANHGLYGRGAKRYIFSQINVLLIGPGHHHFVARFGIGWTMLSRRLSAFNPVLSSSLVERAAQSAVDMAHLLFQPLVRSLRHRRESGLGSPR